jgi:hypothetical protein
MAAAEEEVKTLFVSGLPDDIKEREIHNLFRIYDGYETCQLKYSGRGFQVSLISEKKRCTPHQAHGIMSSFCESLQHQRRSKEEEEEEAAAALYVHRIELMLLKISCLILELLVADCSFCSLHRSSISTEGKGGSQCMESWQTPSSSLLFF